MYGRKEKGVATEMYLDESKRIDFTVPKTLEIAVQAIDNSFYHNDDLGFALLREDVEVLTKQSYINGNITSSQLNIIFSRYGLR